MVINDKSHVNSAYLVTLITVVCYTGIKHVTWIKLIEL